MLVILPNSPPVAVIATASAVAPPAVAPIPILLPLPPAPPQRRSKSEISSYKEFWNLLGIKMSLTEI